MPTTRPPARLERSYLLLLSFLLILNASNYLPWQPKWLVKVFILISSLIEPELCSNLHIRLAHHCPKVVFFFFCCHCLFCFSFFFFYLFTTNAHNLKNLPFFFPLTYQLFSKNTKFARNGLNVHRYLTFDWQFFHYDSQCNSIAKIIYNAFQL